MAATMREGHVSKARMAGQSCSGKYLLSVICGQVAVGGKNSWHIQDCVVCVHK